MMNSVERKLLHEHEKFLDKYEDFMCACCGVPQKRDQAAGVRIYKPRSSILRNNMKPATYAICKNCDNLPEEEIDAKVLKSLSRRGVFA